ncbi:TonB-dependent receptor [Ectothiorhodospiraceae bacterium WFHF3C12]|nr:TonB-dependent receptor [Ectothiorhodospiraceae bacterium WFHF3C12]
MDDEQTMETITVTGTRTSQGRPVSSIPGSMTVIEGEELQKQTRTSNDMGEILSNLVPGLGASSQSLTNFGQQLRGRDMLILIDGVPQTTPLRDVSKHLRIIDPSAIERIEVIRGSVATYGYGATGGIINIITRKGGGEDTRYRTSAGAHGQSGYSAAQSVEGGSGPADFALNLSARETGGYFDADGERIAPDAFGQGGGLSDSKELNLQGQVGYQLTDTQRLRVAANAYRITQDTNYVTDDNPDDPAYAMRGDPPGDNPGTQDVSLTLDHTLEEFLGGTLSSQLYYQDYQTKFTWFEGYETGPGQSELISEKYGARVAHERGLPAGIFAVYGLDLLQDTTSQSLIDGRTSVPEIEQLSYAPFLQLEWPVARDWMLRGGVRYENVRLDVPTFANETYNNPTTLRGGELTYDETVFNVGAVYFLTDRQELFASFSQGFSVADVGRVLRSASASGAASDVEAIDPEAQVVDNYEIGWRGSFNRVDASVSAFYNTSDLGTTFDNDLNIQRQKEEIYGIELTADWRVSLPWTVGGSYSWQEGKADTDDDGDVDDYLPVTRISPPKLTAYTEYATGRWDARLQANHFFARKHDDYAAAFGGVDTDAYTVVDLGIGTRVGHGTLDFGVGNLFNEEYTTPLGTVYGDFRQSVPGRGRHYSLSYAVRY